MNKISTLFTGRLAALVILLNITYSGFAQNDIPDGYYDKAEGLASAQLKTALSQIIKEGERLSYGSGTWTGFEKCDRHPDGYVWDMYSYEKRYFPGGGSAPGGMNIEHSVAKSWWGGTKNDAYKDLYHLNPSDATANSARSNYPLGVVKSGKTVGSLKIGNNSYGSEYNSNSFEPLDEYKGDFARAYMYMFTCYEDLNWTGTNAPSMLNNNKYPMLRPWAAKMLLEWNELDPVSEKEINRAAEIYKIQGNRNPFIDYPELAEHLWGSKVGEPFEFTENDDPKIVSPSNNSSFSMPEVHYTMTSTLKVTVKAKNMTSPLDLRLEGDKKNLFSLSRDILYPSEGIIDNEVIISYNPVKAEETMVNIIISSAKDEVQQRSININAVSTEDFYAVAAENVTHNSFTAKWTALSSANEFDIDVYTKHISGEEQILIGEADFDGSLDEGWSLSNNSYADYTSEAGTIRLASGSKGAELYSPEYDLSKGGLIYVNTKKWNSDSGVKLTVSIDDKEIDAIEPGSDYEEFEISFDEAGADSKICFSTVKGKRLFISNIEVMTKGIKIEDISLPGYPKTIKNATSHNVENLNEGSYYFYTVTPINSEWSKSDEIMVVTPISASVDKTEMNDYKVYSSNGIILVKNLNSGERVSVYNIAGKLLSQSEASSSDMRININEQGVYIVVVENDSVSTSFKVSLYN